QVLVLIEVVANSHPQRVERGGLVGKAGDQDRHHVRVKERQIFQQLQPVGTGAQVPVEDGQVDRLAVGMLQRRLGVGGDEHAAIEAGMRQPFLKGAADRLFIFDDQNSFAHRVTPPPCYAL